MDLKPWKPPKTASFARALGTPSYMTGPSPAGTSPTNGDFPALAAPVRSSPSAASGFKGLGKHWPSEDAARLTGIRTPPGGRTPVGTSPAAGHLPCMGTKTPLSLEGFFWPIDAACIRDIKDAVTRDTHDSGESKYLLLHNDFPEDVSVVMEKWDRRRADAGTEIMTLQCPICAEWFADERAVDMHMDVCTGPSSLCECPLCGMELSTTEQEAHVSKCLTDEVASVATFETDETDEQLTTHMIAAASVNRLRELFPAEFNKACNKLPDGSPRWELRGCSDEHKAAIIDSMLDALVNGQYIPSEAPKAPVSAVDRGLAWHAQARQAKRNINPATLLSFRFAGGPSGGPSGSSGARADAVAVPITLTSSASALLSTLFDACTCGSRAGTHSHACNERAYSEARSLSQQLYATRAEDLKRAQLARGSGTTAATGDMKRVAAAGTAAFYMRRARETQQKAEEASLVASHILFCWRNTKSSYSHTDGGTSSAGIGRSTHETIDLHGQHAEEAVTLLVDTILPRCAANGTHTLRVITGAGTHSDGGKGKAPMKRRVGETLKQAFDQGRFNIRSYDADTSSGSFLLTFAR